MKIGVLTEIISGHSGARAPLEIGIQLANLGHEVTVYAYDWWLDSTMLKYLEKNSIAVTLMQKPKAGKYFIIPILLWRLKKDKPNILYFSGTPPFFISGWLSGIPIVRMYQGTQFDAYLEYFPPDSSISIGTRIINTFANIFIYLIDFMSFRLSVAVVAISQFAAQEGESLYHRKVTEVVYHGVSQLEKITLTQKKEQVINILSVSRITPYKGFHIIIEALKKVRTRKKFVFTIAGSQPKPDYINYLKKIAGPWLRIVIDPSDRHLAHLYHNSDIYATCDRYLYFGLPVGEAARFGKPAVSLNFAAAKEIIKHGQTGYVARNLSEFSHHLERLVNNLSLRRKFGLKAKHWIKKFTWARSGKAWEKILLSHAI